MNSRVLAVLVVLTLMAVPLFAADEPVAATSFAQAVISKAITLMPEDLRPKLTAVQKDILAAAKPAKESSSEPCYFVGKEEGSGPSTLADQFRTVRKKVSEKVAYSSLAPYLGKLTGTTIAICQPSHTSETAFKDKAHAAFEKTLDTNAASLKAEFDGNQKVTNPSEYAIQAAKRANDLLPKLNSTEADVQAESRTSVFTLAANSVADCWWTLLYVEKPKAETTSATEEETEAATTDGKFIGNLRSLKFHLPSCRYLPAEKNRIYFQTRDEATSQGYVACKVCKP